MTLKDKLDNLKEKHPGLSTLYLFTTLISGSKMTRRDVLKHFRKLVDKSDWEGTDKKQLLEWLTKHANE